MHLISINIGAEQPIQIGGKPDTTGIFKQPASGAVTVTTLGLAGDAVCDTKNHGGPDQAVYIYGQGDYDWWAQELDQALPPGTFGDNLTISELESAGFNVGDRLHIGEVILEVTAPRIPCGTLSARMGDKMFVKRFRAAGRPGLYCRVIRTGSISTGDPVRVEACAGPTVSIGEMYRNHFLPDDETFLRRCLAAPIAIRAREDMEAKLRNLVEP
mgnify:CR=1 FL=1